MASGPFVVGLDVGTTSAKAVVLTLAGEQVGAGRAAMRWRRAPMAPGPAGGARGGGAPAGAEMDARDLTAAITGAVGAALAETPPGRVAALGATGMGECGVLLGARGQPVAPVVAWYDDRDLAEVDELAEEVGADALALATGLPLRRQWTLTKHRHALRHDPRGAGAAVRRLNVGEWAVRVLGGEEVSDASLASRTGWLHLPTRTWWDRGLAFSGIDAALLPPLVEPGTACGTAGRARRSAGGRDTALDRLAGAVLTTAGHDHQAAALGAGAAGRGSVLDSSGTAEALVRTAAPHLPDGSLLALTRAGITVGWHVVPRAWCLLGATEGGLALQAARDAAGPDGGAPNSGAPDSGASDAAGRRARWLAAVEAATAEAAALLAVMDDAAGAHTELVVTGGWARDPDVLAAKKRLLHGPGSAGGAAGDHGARFVLSEHHETGARGAALLAGRAAGLLDPGGGWVDAAPTGAPDAAPAGSSDAGATR